MEIFKQLKKLGYKHYVDLTIEELDKLPIDNIERRIECSLVIDWFREKYKLYVNIEPKITTEWEFSISELNKGLLFGNKSLYINKNLDFYEAREQAILKTIELIKIKYIENK